jgi:hypothetical protein
LGTREKRQQARRKKTKKKRYAQPRLSLYSFTPFARKIPEQNESPRGSAGSWMVSPKVLLSSQTTSASGTDIMFTWRRLYAGHHHPSPNPTRGSMGRLIPSIFDKNTLLWLYESQPMDPWVGHLAVVNIYVYVEGIVYRT